MSNQRNSKSPCLIAVIVVGGLAAIIALIFVFIFVIPNIFANNRTQTISTENNSPDISSYENAPTVVEAAGNDQSQAEPGSVGDDGEAVSIPAYIKHPFDANLERDIYINYIISYIVDCGQQGVLSKNPEENDILANSDWKFILDDPVVNLGHLTEADKANGFVFVGHVQVDILYDNHTNKGWRQGSTGVEEYAIHQDGTIYLYNDITVYGKAISDSVLSCERIGLYDIDK